IGDEIRDIRAARDVGMAAGAVAWGYNNAAALEALAPTALFEDVAAITTVVAGLAY
ncbi:MAG: HAD hydrolase-like protein, partial [Anaerolineae bacterium]|nr:HAD hydrolase-like protein [Anaerolineae bacterium]